MSTAIENNDGEPVTDTTENSSRILDTITPSTNSNMKKLSIVKQSITNLETPLFTTVTLQQPDQTGFTDDRSHRSSILIETRINEPLESSRETVTFDPLINPTETKTKNPEISNLIPTASNQPLSANARQAEDYLVIILPLIGLSLVVCLLLGLYYLCKTKKRKHKIKLRLETKQVSILKTLKY